MIAICRQDKSIGTLIVNEITSIYDKENLWKMMIKAYQCDKKFYKNKKTEQYVTSIGFYFPKGITYALSTKYDKTTFTKSQVEKFQIVITHEILSVSNILFLYFHFIAYRYILYI